MASHLDLGLIPPEPLLADFALHQTIDGSTVHLHGPLEFSLPLTSFARWTVEDRSLQLHAGPRDYARTVATRDLQLADLSEQYSVQGGIVSIGTWTSIDSPDGEYQSIRKFVLWEGAEYSFFVNLPGLPSEEIISILSSFVISETAIGVSVVPTDPATTRPLTGGVNTPFAFKITPGVGVLEISPLTPDAVSTFPKWEGLRVDGGELFRLEDIEMTSGGHRPVLLLLTESARVYIDLDLEVPFDESSTRAGHLQVSWGSAAP